MLFGWKVTSAAKVSSVITTVVGIFMWAVTMATPTMAASLDINWIVLAPAMWLLLFAYGCLMDNTDKL